jgi:hypothetical protein
MADKPEPKKRKSNPAFGERKKRQKERVFTVVKTGVKKLCRDQGMYDLIQTSVLKCSVIACEASMLASYHVLRLVETQEPLPVMDHTFFNQCVSSIANLESGRTCERRNPALVESLRQYRILQPEGYQPVQRLPCMTQMLVMVAQQAQENFAVSTALTLTGRMARWFRLQIKLHGEETGTTYFTDNESKVIKSIVSVLTRASTEEPYSVAAMIPRYTRFQEGQYPIPPEDLTWMQSLCDGVRARIGPLPLRVQQQPQDYLQFLHTILRDLEVYNQRVGPQVVEVHGEKRSVHAFKLFSLLPQKRVRPLNIKINNTVLSDLHKNLANNIHLTGRDLWEYYFNTRSIFKSERKEIEEFMVTDGLSASLVVSRPKTSEDSVKKTEQKRAKELLESANRVVASDPGRNPIFTAVVHNEAAMETLRTDSPNNVKHEVIQWSKRKFYHEAGYIHRGKVTKLWTGKAPLIEAFNRDMPSTKTSTLEAYKVHIRHVLTNMDEVMSFYNAQRFKRLRWKTYINRQKAYEKLVADLTAGDRSTLIVWGDARFPSAGRGSPAVPTSSLRKKVGSRARTIDHDEFRSSKLSCCCHTELQGLVDPETGSRSWALRVCQNNACPRNVWDRNVSAAINILHLFLCFARGQGRPAAFRRSNAIDEADVVEPIVEVS